MQCFCGVYTLIKKDFYRLSDKEKKKTSHESFGKTVRREIPVKGAVETAECGKTRVLPNYLF